MKKLLILVSILGLASLASAEINSPMWIVPFTDNTLGIELLSGMSSAMDGQGGYWVLTGVNLTSGILNTAHPDIPETLDTSHIYHDAGDTGLFPYGIGVWGEFSTSNSSSWTAASGIYAYNFTFLEGAYSQELYKISDDATTITRVDLLTLDRPQVPPIPEPTTIALLCLGGLMLRRRK
jgi:hypothetical protein